MDMSLEKTIYFIMLLSVWEMELMLPKISYKRDIPFAPVMCLIYVIKWQQKKEEIKKKKKTSVQITC